MASNTFHDNYFEHATIGQVAEHVMVIMSLMESITEEGLAAIMFCADNRYSVESTLKSLRDEYPGTFVLKEFV